MSSPKKNPSLKTCRAIGLMSGTSGDGLDIALIEAGESFKVLEWTTVAYPGWFRAMLFRIQESQISLDELTRAHFLWARFAGLKVLEFVEERNIALSAVEVVGSHGHTLRHLPEKNTIDGLPTAATLQIGDGSVLAQELGVTVVCDFRPADIGAGGQGAPLVPAFDAAIFQDPNLGRVMLNLGGIANITSLPRGTDRIAHRGFDTGPANMVLDGLTTLATNGTEVFDKGGERARQGVLSPTLLEKWQGHPFFLLPPPKSTGREAFGETFVAQAWQEGQALGLSVDDLLATAAELTARTVAEAIERWVPPPVDEVIASGGGVHNAAVLAGLRRLLPGCRVTTTDEFGIPSDAKEAAAFAWLGLQTLRGKAVDLTGVTGALRPVVLGKLCRP